MKITKLVHACLLVETKDDVTIFDPGSMSYDSKLLDISVLTRLDHIVITHKHEDHFSEDFVKELVAQFPDVIIISTPEVVSILGEKGIKSQSTGDNLVELFDTPHENMAPLASVPMPQNIVVSYMGLLTHPGDSYGIKSSKDIFALPLAGPWGATIEGVRLATELRPKVVLPIHDWMWNEDWKHVMYGRMEDYFAGIGIRFVKLIDGESVEL
jgi:L-ascorbate metabolism protein UlaG (beta-lactamase superfamily)